MNFMTKLKDARGNNDLTQAQLSKKLHVLGRKVSAQQVSSWERGDFFPSHEKLTAICEALKLDINYFIKKTGHGETPPFPHSETDLPNEFSLVDKRKGAASAGPGLRLSLIHISEPTRPY